MTPSRREFLKASLAGGSLVGLSGSVPLFLRRAAVAAPPSNQPGGKDTILVVVQLTGGNDGLNTVIPFADPEYAKVRPTLRIPTNQVKKIDDSVGLHPSMESLAKLLDDHSLCVVQGVGYPNPNQSHFRSMDIWQAGSTNETLTEGWLGKALKTLPKAASFHLAGSNDASPLALAGAPARVPTISALSDFQLQTVAASGSDKKEQRAVIEGAATAQDKKADLLGFVQQTAANTYASSRRLQEIGAGYQPKATYPPFALANRLKLAAQLIDADLGARLFYVALEGFDTHANQANTHATLLRQLSDSMAAFYQDMAARGHKDRIVMMTFSEFGRRVHENGSRGTDHGTAAPMFLVGGKVHAGVVGKHPSLTDLAFGNLKHGTDFRKVYAALLEGWLGVPSQNILGKKFDPAPVLRL